MKKEYKNPNIEIIEFDKDDVITASGAGIEMPLVPYEE